MNFIKVDAGHYEINTVRDFIKDMPDKKRLLLLIVSI